jgi:hypothetical protein
MVKNDHFKHPMQLNISKKAIDSKFGGTPDTSSRHLGWELLPYGIIL